MVAGVLAIDAGNSKTDIALIATDGRLVGTARGGPFLPHRVGAEEAVAGLVAAVQAACTDAGLAHRDEGPMVRHVSACLANADLPSEQEALEDAVAARGWGESSAVFNDTFAVLRAGVDEPRGVAVVCGAGINCSGLLPRRDHRALRCRRAHLRRLGWRRGPVAGGHVVGSAGGGRPRA